MAQKEKTKPGNNGYDPEKVKQVVGACEGLLSDIAKVKSENALKCKDLKAEIKDIIDDAKTRHGIPKGAIRQVLKIHEYEDKARRARDDQEEEVQNSIDMVRHALGDLADTPLGLSVVK